MNSNFEEDKTIKTRIDKIRYLCTDDQGSMEFYEAASLAQSVVYDTVGGNHPIMTTLKDALNSGDWQRSAAASKTVVTMYEQGALKNPRLGIAFEIEDNFLDIAQEQVKAAEINNNITKKQLQLAIGVFLAGAALEDALRRLCDSNNLQYDTQRTSISKLQSSLFQPSNQIEIISSSENKQITVWGDTRNKADHGHFEEISHSDALTMIIGVRAFITKHLSV